MFYGCEHQCSCDHQCVKYETNDDHFLLQTGHNENYVDLDWWPWWYMCLFLNTSLIKIFNIVFIIAMWPTNGMLYLNPTTNTFLFMVKKLLLFHAFTFIPKKMFMVTGFYKCLQYSHAKFCQKTFKFVK